MDALLWQEKSLSLLDQTAYPQEEVWLHCADYRDALRILGTPAVAGEAIISVAGAYAYCLAAMEFEGSPDFYKQLTQVKQEILATHPESKALPRAFQQLDKAYEEYRNSDQLVTALLATGVTIHRQDVIACRTMNREGREIIPSEGNIVLSCTGGVFHTGGMGGPLGILQSAHRKYGLGRVFVCERRPGMQGIQIAHELAKRSLPVSLIPDQCAATLMPRRSCDMVLLEGLQVAANGDLLCAPGAYELAIAAYFHSIQVYATAFTQNIALDIKTGEAFPQEDADPNGLALLGGRSILPEGVDAWVPKYDMVPAYLLTGLITEKGIAFPDFSESVPEILTKTPERPVLFL